MEEGKEMDSIAPFTCVHIISLVLFHICGVENVLVLFSLCTSEHA